MAKQKRYNSCSLLYIFSTVSTSLFHHINIIFSSLNRYCLEFYKLETCQFNKNNKLVGKEIGCHYNVILSSWKYFLALNTIRRGHLKKKCIYEISLPFNRFYIPARNSETQLYILEQDINLKLNQKIFLYLLLLIFFSYQKSKGL